MSALKWADRIVVLNRGVIEEQGTHDHLLSRGGLYSRLNSTPAAAASLEPPDFVPFPSNI
jgi:ATP-binding cassette subfamily B protein